MRVVQNPTYDCIDGISLRHFEVGRCYELDALLAAVFFAEQWAVPVADDAPEAPRMTRFESAERRKNSLLAS
jgi:hypothetical protein